MPSLFSPVLHWVFNHLVVLTFLGFIAVAVLGRHAIFGLEPVAENEAETSVQRLPEQPDSAVPGHEKALLESAPQSQPQPQPSGTQRLPEQGSAEPVEKSTSEDNVFRPTQAVSKDHQQFVPLDVVKEAKRAEVGGARPAPAMDKAQLEQLLQSARTAFWEGQLEGSETLYLQYLSLNPADANAFGELGNLYQSMARPQDALDAYYEAGVRFKALGDREQLLQILELLSDAKDPRLGNLRN